jgi:hypothetical protein
MKKKTQSYSLLAMGLFALVLITGCGSNLFGEDDPIEDPLKTGNFDQVIAESDAIINDPSQPTANRERAKVRKSEAQLGSTGFSIIDLMTDIADLEDSETDEDIFDLVNLGEGVTVESLSAALDTMNDVSTNHLAADEAESFSLKKGVVNSLMVLEVIESGYDIENDEFSDSSKTSKQNLDEIINPAGSDPLTTYSSNAVEGFEDSNSFDVNESGDDDIEGIREMDDKVQKLAQINAASQAGTTVTVDSVIYDFTGDDASDSLEVDRALVNIL